MSKMKVASTSIYKFSGIVRSWFILCCLAISCIRCSDEQRRCGRGGVKAIALFSYGWHCSSSVFPSGLIPSYPMLMTINGRQLRQTQNEWLNLVSDLSYMFRALHCTNLDFTWWKGILHFRVVAAARSHRMDRLSMANRSLVHTFLLMSFIHSFACSQRQRQIYMKNIYVEYFWFFARLFQSEMNKWLVAF